MTLVKIFAQLNCTDMDRSSKWYETLFGRAANAHPMDGLAEWHHEDAAGFQLVKNDADAGHGSMTLIVGGLDAERKRLSKQGLDFGAIQSGDIARISMLSDPDGNTIILAEPTAAYESRS